MLKKLAVLLMLVSIFAIACTTSQEADSPTASLPEVGAVGTDEWLITALRTNGSAVESLSTVSQPFFEPDGQIIMVDGQEVQIFEYASEAEAASAAASISATGSSVGTTMLSWLATPHFFKSGNLIVLYVGDVDTVVSSLERVLGSQIAGGVADAQTSPPPAVSTDAVVEMPAIDPQQYVNNEFGLSFGFPTNWAGPEEYIVEQTLRVEVATDAVYPYGTDPTERPNEIANAYHIIIQYDKNGQGNVNSTYQSLAAMQDGESLSDARGMIIRVRQVDLGGLTGFEYIATLSETAQTEPVYGRSVILMEAQSNLLTVLGTPSRVEVADGAAWRDAYRSIDEANLLFYRQIVESIKIGN
jgi:hypothetical protein